jgi:hypothetical protein
MARSRVPSSRGSGGKLFEFRVPFVDPPDPDKPIPPVWVTLPNGDRVASDQRGVDATLSAVLNRRLILRGTAPGKPTVEYVADPLGPVDVIADFPAALGAPPGTFFDYAAIHVLTAATIDRFREVYSQGRFEVRRFRPNIVVEPGPDEKGFVENGWAAPGGYVLLRFTIGFVLVFVILAKAIWGAGPAPGSATRRSATP